MKLGYSFSSGGTLGVSHLGVLKRLEEAGIKPNVITGSSAGSIIGGLYASGVSVDELIDLALSDTVQEIFSDYTVFGLHKNGFGAIKGERMLSILRKKSKNKQFSDLNIACAFNAVNKLNSEEVILKKGSIAEAMRASSSIPVIFKPYFWNGQYLIDGSVANPLPAQIARDLGADHVIGISFKSNEAPAANSFSLGEFKNLLVTKMQDEKFKFLKGLFSLPFVDKILSLTNPDLDLIRKYLEMHNRGLAYKDKVDTLIEANLTDKESSEEMIKQGYKKANLMIEEIHKGIEEKQRNNYDKI